MIVQNHDPHALRAGMKDLYPEAGSSMPPECKEVETLTLH